MVKPSFLVAYLAASLTLPPTAAAQHMGRPMGQQHEMRRPNHMQDMMQRMDAMIASLHQENADLAARVERAQGTMREHQATMLQMGQAVEHMATQMRVMMEGMKDINPDPDVVVDQEMLRAMNQFQENVSSVMRQMEGPMRALHAMRNH